MSHDVFISYSSGDKSAADAACAVLEHNGLRCWIAPRDIVPGQDWSQAIVKAIEKASAFVLVFSANANESIQVKREVELAVNRGIPVVPFRIEDVRPSESLEYFISTQHWMDAMTPPLEKHLEQLARSLHTLIHSEVQGSPPPPPPPSPSQPSQPSQPPQPPQPGINNLAVKLASAATALSAIAIVAVLALRSGEPGPAAPSPPDIEPDRPSATTAPGTLPTAPTSNPVAPDTRPPAPTPTEALTVEPPPPAPQCELTNWDRVPRRLMRNAWPPPRQPSGVFVQLASVNLAVHDDDIIALEAATQPYIDRIWSAYRQAAGADCQSAQVMLYESTTQPDWIGVGLLFRCTGHCPIEPKVRAVIDKLDEQQTFAVPHKKPEKLYFEALSTAD
jgi:hypothetical protein